MLLAPEMESDAVIATDESNSDRDIQNFAIKDEKRRTTVYR
jgi:hypothetical protein